MDSLLYEVCIALAVVMMTAVTLLYAVWKKLNRSSSSVDVAQTTLHFSIYCKTKMVEAVEATKYIEMENDSMKPVEDMLRSVKVFYCPPSEEDVSSGWCQEYDLLHDDFSIGNDEYVALKEYRIVGCPFQDYRCLTIVLAGVVLEIPYWSFRFRRVDDAIYVRMQFCSFAYLFGRLVHHSRTTEQIETSLVGTSVNVGVFVEKEPETVLVLVGVVICKDAVRPILDCLTTAKVTPEEFFAARIPDSLMTLAEVNSDHPPGLFEVLKKHRVAIERNRMLSKCRPFAQTITVSSPGESVPRMHLNLADGMFHETASAWVLNVPLYMPLSEDYRFPVDELSKLEFRLSGVLLSDSNPARTTFFVHKTLVIFRGGICFAFYAYGVDENAFLEDRVRTQQRVIQRIIGGGDATGGGEPDPALDGLCMTLACVIIDFDKIRQILETLGLIEKAAVASEE